MDVGHEDNSNRKNQENFLISTPANKATFNFGGVPSRLAQKLNIVWTRELDAVKALKKMTKKQFRHYKDLPLARIKRIMKSDEDVDMISAEAPILFAKACELFILDVTTRAHYEAEIENRFNIEREDFFNVYHKTAEYDFLSAATQEMIKEAAAAKRKLDEEAYKLQMEKRFKPN